jgi:hypothetical protein
MFPMQTGGAKRTWLFDPSTVHEIPQIQGKMVHYDEYDSMPSQDKIITFVLDHLIDMLPSEEAEAIRMLHIEQQSMRASGREIGVDHKTVGARAKRGLETVRRKIATTPWLADFLQGTLPEDEAPTTLLETKKMFYKIFKEDSDV